MSKVIENTGTRLTIESDNSAYRLTFIIKLGERVDAHNKQESKTL